MSKRIDPSVKAECIRLRVEDRLSLSEIRKQVQIDHSTASVLLKPYPLTQDELSRKRGERRPKTIREDRFPNLCPFSRFMKPIESLTRREKGRIAEAAVLLRLSLLGLVPAKPVFDGETSDWLVEIPGAAKILRVQVKWARRQLYGQPFVVLASSNTNGKIRVYAPSDFDVIVGYDLYTDQCHVWDWDAIGKNRDRVSASGTSSENWDLLLKQAKKP